MRFKLLILLLLISLGSLGFWVYKRYDFTKPFASENSPNAEIVENVSGCSISDYIDYYFYEPKSPTWEKNNKFGLYIYAENADFFELAENLVNSNGGEWGYVLIPYNVKDRDNEKWQRVFDQLNNKKLIPVVQLWDVDLDDYEDQTEEAAEFLNTFLWPIKYRYISVYNEPNDSKFWYGKADAAQYAQILDYTITEFKKLNTDFFILNGALNASAPNDDIHIDSFDFMKKMNQEVPGIFNKLDGWASHSYPQPNFSGNPKDRGRWSIKAYETELDFLKESLGVEKNLPVFITETGWAHAEGKEYNSSYLSVDKVADNFVTAYEDVWLEDDRVRAVMPFTIRYEAPFDHFSWVNQDNIPYKHYQEIKTLEKVAGEPPILQTQNVNVGTCD